jgi:hypothetical protein
VTTLATPRPQVLPLPGTRPDERAARRSLLDQIASLERDTADLFCSSWPRNGVIPVACSARSGGAAMRSLAELERLRDELADRLAAGHRALAERAEAEELSRRLLEEMLLDPKSHAWIRVSHEDIGEPGCRHWHVRPRAGLLGMFARWWRVVVSSGCP